MVYEPELLCVRITISNKQSMALVHFTYISLPYSLNKDDFVLWSFCEN